MENEEEDRIKDVLRMDDSDIKEVTAEEVVKSVVSDVGENVIDDVSEEVINEDMMKDVLEMEVDVLQTEVSHIDKVTVDEIVETVVSDVGENIIDEVLEEVANEVEDDMVKDVFTEVEELVETQHIIEDNKKTEKNSFSHCGLILNEETEQKNHSRKVHSERIPCSICEKMFANKSNLIRHKNTVHNIKPNVTQCDQCGVTLNRADNLKNHAQICSIKEKKKSRTQVQFNCRYCSKTYKHRSNLYRHIKYNHKIKSNGGFYLVPNIISKHKQKKEEYICNLCDMLIKFSNKQSFRKHMKLKHDGRNDIIRTKFSYMKLTECERKKMM